MKTQSALCASAIRKELKEKFPLIKFSVKSENYAGGDSVSIRYENGVPTDMVNEVVKKYQCGSFDSMSDCYNYDNNREDIPQAKYVQASREISPEIREQKKLEIAKKFGIKDVSDEQEWQRVFRCWSDQVMWRELKELTIN